MSSAQTSNGALETPGSDHRQAGTGTVRGAPVHCIGEQFHVCAPGCVGDVCARACVCAGARTWEKRRGERKHSMQCLTAAGRFGQM